MVKTLFSSYNIHLQNIILLFEHKLYGLWYKLQKYKFLFTFLFDGHHKDNFFMFIYFFKDNHTFVFYYGILKQMSKEICLAYFQNKL